MTVDALDSRVLVLNKNYQPINIISVKRALNKVINGRAEIINIEDESYVGYDITSWSELSFLKKECGIDETDEIIGNEAFSLIAPTVIRSLYYDKSYHPPIRLSRKNIFLRDGNICQFCGKKFPVEQLTIDHVLPRAQGGINAWTNLVCSCYRCNNKKGCRTPEEAGMKLLHKPVKPEQFSVFEIPKGTKKYKNWDAFISDIYWATELKE